MSDRFSQLYLERGVPQPDSPRARNRIASYFAKLRHDRSFGDRIASESIQLIHDELGIRVPFNGFYDWDAYFSKCQVRDFLDSITLIYRVLRPITVFRDASAFLPFARRCFQEENLSYRIDDNGVVHFAVDAEYERNVETALASLAGERNAQARAAFERAMLDMRQATPDLLGAIRNMFECAESLHKRITSSGHGLDDRDVNSSLRPYVDKRMSHADSVAKSAAGRLVSSFADWVSAAHPYRHGHDEEKPVVPPLHFAVALVSAGAAYIRWLATLDGQ